MKKIALSKETLRVLTDQETRHVAGAQVPETKTNGCSNKTDCNPNESKIPQCPAVPPPNTF